MSWTHCYYLFWTVIIFTLWSHVDRRRNLCSSLLCLLSVRGTTGCKRTISIFFTRRAAPRSMVSVTIELSSRGKFPFLNVFHYYYYQFVLFYLLYYSLFNLMDFTIVIISLFALVCHRWSIVVKIVKRAANWRKKVV